LNPIASSDLSFMRSSPMTNFNHPVSKQPKYLSPFSFPKFWSLFLNLPGAGLIIGLPPRSPALRGEGKGLEVGYLNSNHFDFSIYSIAL
jgi:hypothetical protein